MTVTPIEGEQWRAHVTSRSRPGHQWLVDLTENAGIGFCGCEAMQFRPHKRCSHVKAWREVKLDALIAAALAADAAAERGSRA